MKVLHLIGGGDTGGAKTHVLNLLYGLNKKIDAHIVCFRNGEFSDEAVQIGIPITVIDTTNPFAELSALKKIVCNETIDVVHCHGARGNLMGSLIKNYLKAPMLTTVHSDYRLDYLGRPAARFSYGTTYMITMRKADYYIGVSDPMTELLIDRKFPAGNIYTIYNGIDFVSSIHHSSRESFFESIKFKVNDGDIVAGISARLNPVKDHSTLLRAMKIASEKVPNLKLVLAGDGEDQEKLERLAQELNISDKVCFAGWLTDMNSFYHAIDINLLTSISETFPYALTEGARMHRATIASRVGGVPVLIDDGKNGFIFEPRNYKQLAEHMITLSTNHSLRKKMGDQLYEKSARLFSIEKMVATQLDIYESVVQRFRRKKNHKRDGIIICGAYGHENAGDEAILQSIIHSVQKVAPHIPLTILAKSTMSIGKKFRTNTIYTFDIPRVLLSMRRSILYINGGGSLLQNITSLRSLAYYLFTLIAARRTKNKVYMYGCGIGPIIGKKTIKHVTNILNGSVDIITLRDPHSMKELQSYGVTEPKLIITSDPALIINPADTQKTEFYLEKNNLDPSGHYACFMVRNWPEFSTKAKDIGACADQLYKTRGLLPVFISMNTLYDTSAAQEIIAHMHVPYIIIDEQLDPEMLISVLAHMDIVVAMRLHGLIFSSISGTPLVGLSYDPKINSFMNYLGYGECIDLPNVTEENLMVAINQQLALLPSRSSLKEHSRRLAEQEQMNGQMVRELLESIYRP